MKKRILISTLGDTPPVVTEAIDSLKGKGIQINTVILLTTKDSYVEESFGFVQKHIYSYYKGEIEVFPKYVGDYEDIADEMAVVEFMKEACGVLKSYMREGNEVYVSIAGGRKTMSALMALAVQFYGAKELFHIIVDDRKLDELEKKSKIDNLRHFSQVEQDGILHPDLNKIKMVRLPFIGLFPWMPEILKVLKGAETKNKEVKEFLKSNNLIENDKPTPFGNLILKILESVESRPERCSRAIDIHISDHHYKPKLQKKAQQIADRFDYVCRITDIEWRKGKEKIIKEPPNKLRVFFDSGTGIKLGLLLETTAKTDGQLTIAEKEVTELLDKL